jgi:acyl-CoA thioester hydrolase
MRQETWRRDPSAYPIRGELAPRYTDVDVWQHMNNTALIGLHGETLHHALRAVLGPQAWRASQPIVAFRRNATDFLAEAHYPETIVWGARVLGAEAGGLRIATALFQHERCVGLHETTLCGWHEGRATGLGDATVAALRAANVPGADAVDPAAAPDEPDEPPPTLESLPWRTAIATRFADSDARRLASDNFLARCAEQVRVEFLGQTFGSRERRMGSMMVAHVALRWLGRAAPGRHWEAGCGLTRVSERSFAARSAFYEDGRCVAVSDSVMVSIDPESRRSAPMTEQARALLAPWQVADPATPG